MTWTRGCWPDCLRHVGDVLRRRRIPGRHDQVVALRQEPHIGAVLVHDGEPLAPVLLRTGLVDEHHAGVEETAEAGDLGVDGIGNDMADAAPEIRVREVLLPDALLARGDVPQPEFRLQPPGSVTGDAACDKSLGPSGAPRLKARSRVEGRPLGKARLVESREIAGALQVVGDYSRDPLPEIALAGKIGNRDRHRLELSAGPDPETELGVRARSDRHQRRDDSERNQHSAKKAGDHGTISRIGLSVGTVSDQERSNWTLRVFQSL